MNIREIALFLTWATPTFGSNNCRAQLLWMYRQKLPQMIDYSGEHHEVSWRVLIAHNRSSISLQPRCARRWNGLVGSPNGQCVLTSETILWCYGFRVQWKLSWAILRTAFCWEISSFYKMLVGSRKVRAAETNILSMLVNCVEFVQYKSYSYSRRNYRTKKLSLYYWTAARFYRRDEANLYCYVLSSV
jgi:hypothetical protein